MNPQLQILIEEAEKVFPNNHLTLRLFMQNAYWAAIDEAVRVCPEKKDNSSHNPSAKERGFNAGISQYRKAIEGLKEKV